MYARYGNGMLYYWIFNRRVSKLKNQYEYWLRCKRVHSTYTPREHHAVLNVNACFVDLSGCLTLFQSKAFYQGNKIAKYILTKDDLPLI